MMVLALSAEAVHRTLGGVRIASGFLCRCPVASHGQGFGDRNPSLCVSNGDRGLVFWCFAGCEMRSIRSALGHLDLTRLAQPATSSRAARPLRKTTADALALWRAAKPVPGTRAAKYLAARGLPLPPPTLRYLPNVPFSQNRRFDCLIAAMQASTREIVAVQLTFLHPHAPEKAPVPEPRGIHGPSRGAALRLAAPAATLGLAEGYETAHAAMLMTGIPTWASLGSERLPLVIIPPGVETVIIFADPDAPGIKAAEKFRQQHGHLIVEIRPPPGSSDYAAEFARQMRPSPLPQSIHI